MLNDTFWTRYAGHELWVMRLPLGAGWYWSVGPEGAPHVTTCRELAMTWAADLARSMKREGR